MSDFANYMHKQDITARWRAEHNATSYALDLAQVKERCAELISQHEPVNSLRLHREDLRHVLRFLHHGDMDRLHRDLARMKREEAQHECA